MVSILRRHKVLPCVLKFHRDHELYFGLKDLIILTISSTQNSKDESLSLILKFIFRVTALSLDIRVYCLAKKLLNRFALSKESVTSLLSTSSGGISGILLPFTNVFKMAQYVFGLFAGHLGY